MPPSIRTKCARVLLDGNPAVRSAVRRLQYRVWRAQCTLRRVASGGILDADRLIYVAPQDIRLYHGGITGSRFMIRACVRGGDWDLKATSFTGWDVYRSMRSHFEDGVRWEDTTFYSRVCGALNAGSSKWGCRTPADFHERLKHLDQLFESMSTNGYKTHIELLATGEGAGWEGDSPFYPHDEIVVCIGRGGELILRDGKHRLSIARICGLDAIPVAVGIRHAEWHRLRQRVIRHGWDDITQSLRTHPDLTD